MPAPYSGDLRDRVTAGASARSAAGRFGSVSARRFAGRSVGGPILDDVPIDVRLAVLVPSGLPQKHHGANRGAETQSGEWGRSSLQPIPAILANTSPINSIARSLGTQNRILEQPIREVGLRVRGGGAKPPRGR